MRLILAALLAAAVPAPAFAQVAQNSAAQDSVSSRDNIDALIAEHARAYKVPAAFVHRVVKRESNYNARAKGGSALGLMQIKHATARGLGYSGDAAGLYDPNTNLKYGIAYLAGAYRAAQGDLEQAYRYYNRGYYYVAKRLGIEADVPQEAAPATTVAAASSAKSANGFDGLFALRGSAPAAGTQALAYAAPGTVPADAIEVPLPPRRPAALSGAAEPAQTPVQVAAVQAAAAPVAYTAAPAPVQAAAAVQLSDAVEVPLPPRRPSETVLASVARPVTVARKAPATPVMEAAAIAATP
ncbi:transglycosylase SLT domain-containing protein [Methylorubrum salsuginis]|uniref:Transglycosylase SLT domain-containing protein n=1 Tax=Methylorubrum salsuginis TaxID=414703 RepID=A0A1I4E8W5_9HYPH|nr:transglycosylase SLT domain-containing protein [Methylorubrum salsuginis]SFL02195.1 Transglycosylase SLT domain-containing protein [Methylorubrum salsuginis]